MAVDFVAVGAYLEGVRHSKQFSRQRLAKALGWSEKTLQRIELGQVDMKLSQFVAYLNALTADSASALRLTAPPEAAPAYIEAQLAAAVAARDLGALDQLTASLTALRPSMPVPWVNQEINAVGICRYELTGKIDKAATLAKTLFRQLAEYDTLTPIDYRLVARILKYQPYQQLRLLFAVTKAGHASWCRDASITPPVWAALATGLMDSAIASDSLTAVGEVAACVLAYAADTRYLQVVVMQGVASAVQAGIAGDWPAAQRRIDALTAGLAALMPNRAEAAIAAVSRPWASIKRIAEND